MERQNAFYIGPRSAAGTPLGIWIIAGIGVAKNHIEIQAQLVDCRLGIP